MDVIILWITYILVFIIVTGLALFLFNIEFAVANGALFSLIVLLVLRERLDEEDEGSTSFIILYIAAWILFVLTYGYYLVRHVDKHISPSNKEVEADQNPLYSNNKIE